MRNDIHRERVNICGIYVDTYTLDEIVDLIVNHALSSNATSKYVVTPNAHHILLLKNDPYFREIYRNAFLVVPDGVSFLWAGNFLGTPFQGRVNGTDLFERLCAVAAKERLGVFLLGGRPGAADGAARVLKDRHRHLSIVGIDCPPYGFEEDRKELKRINTKIEAASPHFLFVGLGAPKQEKWIYENIEELDVPISVGIGVSFEFVAGMVGRSPEWMQKVGLEWLFRLLIEPRRLWKRYLVGNPLFLWWVLKQRLGLLPLGDAASGYAASEKP